MLFRSGAGAISRQVMGNAVIGGMLAATCIGVFLIPVTFYVVEKLGHRPTNEPTVSASSNQGGPHHG